MNHFVNLTLCAIVLIFWTFYFVHRAILSYNNENMRDFVWYVCMVTFNTVFFIAMAYTIKGVI